ncbi:MAG: hypothetical protein HGA44_06145 [Cellulomonadaceae bacterium]|nr:hypothetical protein [Cellulomonadaceae bacterium]
MSAGPEPVGHGRTAEPAGRPSAVRSRPSGPPDAVERYHRRRRPAVAAAVVLGLVYSVNLLFMAILTVAVPQAWWVYLVASVAAVVLWGVGVTVVNVANKWVTPRMTSTASACTVLAGVAGVIGALAFAVGAMVVGWPGLWGGAVWFALLSGLGAWNGAVVRRVVRDGLASGVELT